jgi:hypothetical protein
MQYAREAFDNAPTVRSIMQATCIPQKVYSPDEMLKKSIRKPDTVFQTCNKLNSSQSYKVVLILTHLPHIAHVLGRSL